MSDLQNKLNDFYLEQGIIHINEDFTPQLSNKVIKELLFLHHILPEESKISILLNSKGGSGWDCKSILCIMDKIKNNRKIECIGLGYVASAAFVVLINASLNLRKCYSYTRLNHHFSKWTDENYTYNDTLKRRDYLKIEHTEHVQYLSAKLNKTIEQIEQDFDREFNFSAQDALDYGVVDKIL